MEGLNDASREAVLSPRRGGMGPRVRKMIPAEVNCALCACAALCSHIFQEEYTSRRVLRVMWHEIIAKQQVRQLRLSAPEQEIQQHQLSFKYFLDEIDRDPSDNELKPKPWILMEDPYKQNIDGANRSQRNGMERFIREELERRNKTHEVKKYEGDLENAINYMIAKGSENWVFALLVSGQASFAAEAGSEGKVFGHWNFAYLTTTDIGLKARFIDYQGREAVRSTQPVCAAANNLVAEPGGQETLLIAVNSEPWRSLIPKSITRRKAPEQKQKNPLRPHAMSTTRAATTPADKAAVFPAPPSAANNRRQPTPRRTTRPRDKSRKRSRSKKK